MADYNKATNFTAKDTLPTGNSGKIVKGAEIDTELSAVSNAIASKSDINSPSFTGTPVAPTATAGSNTTQLANTAYVRAEITALSLGNMSTQAKSAVDITGGTITGITDLAVADGGTGRSTLAANAVLVGNGTSGINTVAPGTSGNFLKSNGTAWTSASLGLQGLGFGGETWQNTTGSRAFNQTYTNSRSYPIQVAMSLNLPSGGGYDIFCNGVAVGRDANTANVRTNCSFIVPPGGTYSVNGTGSIFYWNELY